jgi:AraC family transcriptional regulator, melibiose operon regulatory protein
VNGKNIVDLKFGLHCDVLRVSSYKNLHRHDEIEILFFPNATPATVRFGAQVVEIQPDQTVLFWGAIPHQLMSIEDQSLQYWVAIPPEAFLYFDLSQEVVRDVMNGKMLVEREPDHRAIDLASFPVWKRELASRQEDVRRTLLMSLEARLRRFRPMEASPYSLGSSRPRLLAPRDRSAIQAMYDFISVNFREPIRVDDVAEAAGLHPNYAISLFKKKCGINIVALVTMLRVYEAQRLILTTDRKIIDVAMETGFRTMSNFYKSFRKVTGRSPGDYRQTVHPARAELRPVA